MVEESIKNLGELVQKSVGSTKRVIKSTAKRLTVPGENYLGVVNKVEAVVRNEKGEEEYFTAVAKCVHSNMPESMKLGVQNKFEKENGFYTVIVPTLEEFRKEVGLEEKGVTDIFPKLYFSRRSLDENKEVADEDSVLVLEYLGDKGYVNTDRTVGFDLEGAKLLLQDLAAFHAIPIALKIKKPEVFEDKIKKYAISMFKIADAAKPKRPLEVYKVIDDMWFNILASFDEVKPYLEKFREKLANNRGHMMGYREEEPKGPFATICHNDFWTNNTMQIIEDGKPKQNKILDFQTLRYSSATQDLIFFLWSSVQLVTLHEHFDALLKFYHGNFINLLDKCGCDTTPFNYENFLKDVEESARIDLMHIMFMQAIIYGNKGEAVLEVQKMDKMVDQFRNMSEKFTETAKKRVAAILVEFGKRGWL